MSENIPVVNRNTPNDADSSTDKKVDVPAKKCQVCQIGSSIYCCPKCHLRSCSLTCCKQHKSDSACDGIRNVAQFVTKCDFSDLNLLSDYRFLEDVDRAVGNYARDNLKIHPGVFRRSRQLSQAASKRGVELTILPAAMQRHKVNTTHFDGRSKTFFWTVEFRIPNNNSSDDKRSSLSLFLHGCQESESLSSLLDRVLTPTKQSADVWFQLKPRAGLLRREGRLFLRCEPSTRLAAAGGRGGGAFKRYREVTKATLLGHAIGGVRLVEYPTFELVMGDCAEKLRAE